MALWTKHFSCMHEDQSQDSPDSQKTRYLVCVCVPVGGKDRRIPRSSWASWPDLTCSTPRAPSQKKRCNVRTKRPHVSSNLQNPKGHTHIPPHTYQHSQAQEHSRHKRIHATHTYKHTEFSNVPQCLGSGTPGCPLTSHTQTHTQVHWRTPAPAYI